MGDLDQGPDANLAEMDEEERVKQIEEAHLAESLERLILEAYKLLHGGEMAQAESLLQEGNMFHLLQSQGSSESILQLCFTCIAANIVVVLQ